MIRETTMPTFHIEHPITDFGTWKAAFARVAPIRAKAGKCTERKV